MTLILLWVLFATLISPVIFASPMPVFDYAPADTIIYGDAPTGAEVFVQIRYRNIDTQEELTKAFNWKRADENSTNTTSCYDFDSKYPMNPYFMEITRGLCKFYHEPKCKGQVWGDSTKYSAEGKMVAFSFPKNVWMERTVSVQCSVA